MFRIITLILRLEMSIVTAKFNSESLSQAKKGN